MADAPHTSNRRKFLSAAALGLSLAAIPATVAAAPLNLTSDAALENAWARRLTALEAYRNLAENGDTEEEKRIWAVVDKAEEEIRSVVATTPRGAAIQLWTALAHSITTTKEEAAVERGDLLALEQMDPNLDWNERLMLSALKSLTSMGDA